MAPAALVPGQVKQVAEELERLLGVEIAIKIRFLVEIPDAGLGRDVTR